MKRFFDWAACGTAAQYRKHLRHGIPPCQACLKAERRRVQDAYRRRKRRALMPPPVEHEAEPDRTELTEIPEPPRRLPFGGVDEQWLSDFSQMIRQVNADLNEWRATERALPWAS
ncbi:hypothetical protein [Mycolicibacterium phlei]|uniref:hypothetical protein n=1 Tax=Mycolicibacterium phlei TaxID=1771 RepID=UPI000A2EED07|nr:hypothetical protein [Mycolicibacterium phlei]